MNTNTQPVEKQIDSPHLDIFKVWQTIQGEGPLAGRPAVFVRLAGCNLMCPLCDTDYTSTRRKNTVFGLVEQIKKTATRNTRLVVITGGEPFRQKLGPFVDLMIKEKWNVQIETNGTLYEEQFPYHMATIVCSPKTPAIHKKLAPEVDALKYVVRVGEVDPTDGLPTSALGMGTRVVRPEGALLGRPVYIQPCDEQDPAANRANMDLATQICMEHGYILCLQMHKYAGLE